MNTTSKFLSLDWKDAGKGLIVAAGGAAVSAVLDVLKSGSLTFDWKAIGVTALSAGIAYLVKNFFTPQAATTKTGA